jgi:hypothetical protein
MIESDSSLGDGRTGCAVILKDVSKFVQSSVNDTLLTTSSREMRLRDGDVLKFGAATETFTLVFDPINIGTSSSADFTELVPPGRRCGVV